MTGFKIRKLEAFCFRYPLSAPVVTSFARMNDRPALFVRAEDEDGGVGWGEVWCNFPPPGAEHRARLITEILAPMFRGRAIEHPSEMFDYLTAATSVMALQSGEPGPFAQSIAGVDLALWDLFARRARQPLWRMLGASSPRMRAYASGINPDGAVATAERAMQRGHRAFKLKIGFGVERDQQNLRDLRWSASCRSRSTSTRAGRWVRRSNRRRRSTNSGCSGWRSPCGLIVPGASGARCALPSRLRSRAVRISRDAKPSRRRSRRAS